MQRLFSTFADGWPGRGLLLQRLLTGAALVYRGVTYLRSPPQFGFVLPEIIGALGGLLIIAGLWTPIVGVLIAIVEAWIALSSGSLGVPLILGVLGGTLAMIGPGAWSIDARLFGRKRIHTPDL